MKKKSLATQSLVLLELFSLVLATGQVAPVGAAQIQGSTTSQSSNATSTATAGVVQPQVSRMKTITNAQRRAAATQARANRVALRRAAKSAATTRMSQPANAASLKPALPASGTAAAVGITTPKAMASAVKAAATSATAPLVPVGIPGAAPAPNSCMAGMLDFFNCGNYANSPLPEFQGQIDANGNPVLDANGNPVLAKDANGYYIPKTGTGIRKFVDTLAGVGKGNANDLGNYIPIATPDKTTYTGSDYYNIEVKRYTQQLHADLPSTLLQGYHDVTGADQSFHYLGPIIYAKKDVPVRVKFTNSLPTGTNGNLFLPVDPTMKGDGAGPDGTNYPQNRALLHLHGGVTPWISDGTPHQWITPAGETATLKKGDSQRNVPDMPDPGAGSDTWYWTNHQSSRMMWYHDHSYGLTRLNVYTGEVAPFILSDPIEDDMIDGTNNSGANANGLTLLPNQAGLDKSGQGAYRYGIPLVIQDKTFVPPTAATVNSSAAAGTPGYTMDQLNAEDPTWLSVISRTDGTNDSIMGQFGQLWFPHVFMPNQNANLTSGVNNYGRWDYGAWVWPPVTNLTHPAIAGTDPVTGNAITIPAMPNPSAVQEAFMDTPLVNGTPYPTMTVGQKAYRFRILNAANDRHWNLQLYYAVDASGNPCNGTGTPVSACTEVKLIPAVPTAGMPSTWPRDGREGGVPDWKLAGPSIIQIGNEGGLLPAPAVIPSQPINYEYNRRVITALNVNYHALLLGPAERADVIFDFSNVPDGATLILYNDAPAPNPGYDTRLDYYTGDQDQSSSGGAPTTVPGYGPNTRTVMQFVVSSTADTTTAGWAGTQAFKTGLDGGIYAKAQDAPLVPEQVYGNSTSDNYAYIQDNLFDTATNKFTKVANATTLNLQPKAIAEEFDTDWGRMTAQLGTELPFTNFLTQTTLQMWYFDPATEIMNNNAVQIWKITHNGVDTHSVHFHMFNVQLINRVAWDGTMYAPDANELGWKESVRMNPLTDAIVAIRPITPPLPFSLPDSYRTLDVTAPLGSTAPGFTNVDPITNNPITVSNQLTNFGWEYVWHCHLLGHEENDMMRPIIIQVPPEAPTFVDANAKDTSGNAVTLGATHGTDKSVYLTWENKASSATGFNIQRSTDATFATGITNIAIAPSVTATSQIPAGAVQSYNDKTANPTVTNYYRIQSTKLFNNQVEQNGPMTSLQWSETVNAAPVAAPLASISPASLVFGITPLKTTAAPQTITVSNSGTADLTFPSAPVITGPAAADFLLSSTCGTVPAKGSCSLTVTFAPKVASAVGGRTAMLTIATNDTINPTLTAALSGTGTGLSITPTTLAFGNVLVNKTGTLTAQLKSVSGTNLRVTGGGISLTAAAGYTMTQNCANNLIRPTGCTLTVKFAPVAAGPVNTTVTISTADPAGAQTVTLTGTGTSPMLTVTPEGPLTFTSNQGVNSASQVVTVSNDPKASAPLSIASINLGGTTPGAFHITSNTCPTGASTLVPGGTCSVTLNFNANASQAALAQPLSAQLNVNVPAASGTSVSVDLTGTATKPAGTVTPSSLIFTRATGSTPQTVTINSTGTAPLTISSIMVSGGTNAQFTVTSNSCPTAPATLAAGSSCTVGVTYKPKTKTPQASYLIINSSSNPALPRVGLSGN